MTLPSELLPAAQHYVVLGAALTLFSLSIAHGKKRFGPWVWLCIVALPIGQINWSLWETIREVLAAGNHAAVFQSLAHAVAILFVLWMVLCMAGRSSNDLPKRVRLEPTVGQPKHVGSSRAANAGGGNACHER